MSRAAVPLLVRAAYDVTGLLAIAAPLFIFYLFCLGFPHTWFTFPHLTKCILPSIPPMSVCGIFCLLCVVRISLVCAGYVFDACVLFIVPWALSLFSLGMNKVCLLSPISALLHLTYLQPVAHIVTAALFKKRSSRRLSLTLS
jgi:hypothetical protein